MKLFRRKFRLILGLSVAIPLLYLGVEHVRGRWMLSHWKHAMGAQGEKFSIRECEPPLALGENGFPAIARLAAAGSGNLAALYPPTLKFAAAGRLVSLRTLNEWPPGPLPSGSSREVTNVTWAELDLALNEWTNAFEEARVLLELPVFDSRLDYHAGFAIPLMHLAKFKGLAQQLAAASANALHQGNREAALQQLETLLALNRALQNERFIISQLVRQAIAAVAWGATWQALQHPDWTDPSLARLQQAWQRQEFIRPLGHSFEMERAIAIEMYERMRGSSSEAMNQLGLWGGGPRAAPPVNSLSDLAEHLVENFDSIFFQTAFLPLWRIAWSHQDEWHYLEATQPSITACRDAAEHRTGAPAREAETKLAQSEEPTSRMRHLVSWRIAPGLDRTLTKAINTEQQRELVVTAIALRRYRDKHARQAADLAVLVPEILPAIPRDYWGNTPLIYRPTGTGSFLLYSVGSNGTDEGGDSQPLERGSHNFSLPAGRDLVWPEAATPEEALAALPPRPIVQPRTPRPRTAQRAPPPPSPDTNSPTPPLPTP